MSASREKKTRLDPAGMSASDPKTAREAQQRKEERRSNILYASIAVIFVLVAIAAFVWRSNIIPKSATAVTVNGEKYTAAEVEYYYQNVYQNFMSNYYSYFSYMGVDTSASLRNQTVSSMGAMFTGATEGDSWHDYLMGQTVQQITTVQAMLDAAEAEGFTWTDELQAQLDSSLASIETNYGLSVKEYVNRIFGGLMSEKVFKEQLRQSMLASAYATAYQDGLEYSAEELTAAYEADRNAYDLVSYEVVRVNGAPASTDADGNTIEVTDEMTAQALETAKSTAEDIYAALQAGGSLSELAEGSDIATYTESEGTAYSSSVLGEWLFDDARAAGDAELLEDTDNATYYVAVFHDRSREEYNTVSVRHILTMVDETDLDAESETYEADLQARKDEAKAKAEDLLAQWKAGHATEDSFAEMANEFSEDGGSNTTGGLYSGFAQGSMVAEFNDWSFSSARKPGDTGIVYGESANYKGYHVMYFVSTDLPYWQEQVKEDLQTNDFEAWHAEKTEGYTAEQHSFGMKFVG